MYERANIERGPGPGGSWSGDDGARRLFTAVCESCARKADLPGRLAAGIRAALDLLAADPELARLVTVAPHLGADPAALAAQDEWIERFGDLLRAAVADDPRTTASDLPFLAGFVIGGVRLQIARHVLNGEAADLPRLLPGLLEVILSYYFEPGEASRLARAALAG